MKSFYTITLLIACAACVRATNTASPQIIHTGDDDCCSPCDSSTENCFIFPTHCECRSREAGPRIIRPGEPSEVKGRPRGAGPGRAVARAPTKVFGLPVDVAAGGPLNKGAEDDADDCCAKCAEDEACSTTPTGCECWKPSSFKSTAGSSTGGPSLNSFTYPITLPSKAAAGIVFKGAEDDADECCKKCAADEACSTTPTGCECWTPSSVQAMSMSNAGSPAGSGANELGGQEGEPFRGSASIAERVHKEITHFVEEAGHHIGDADWDGVPETYLKALLDISERVRDAKANGVEYEDYWDVQKVVGELVAKIKASPTQALKPTHSLPESTSLYASGRTTGHLIPDDEGQTTPLVDAMMDQEANKEGLHNNGAFLPFVEEAGHHLSTNDAATVKALLDISERVRDGGLTAEQLESVLETFKMMDQEANKEGLHNNGAFLPWHREFMRLAASNGASFGGSVSLEHGPGPHDSVVAADYDGKVKNTLNFVKEDEANHGTLVGNPGDVNNMKDVDVAEESFKAGLFEPYHEVAAGSAKLGAVADLEADAAKFAGKIHPTVEENNVAVLGQANGVSASPEAPDNVAVLGQANGMTNGRPATHGGTGKDLTTAASNANTAVPDVMTNTAEGGLNSFEEVKVTLANDAASDPEIVADNFAVSNEAEGVVQEHPQSNTTSAVLPLAGIGGFALLAGGLAFACRPGARKRRAPATPREEPVPVVNVV